ncbi:MAG: TonB-dependent siderophore receptor [Puniceicoccaceae bacterium 5H]|nr:MAG: TonB-dependent siderophore receptor [Puniceicoccaceae bacterium 5H]
MPDIFKYSLFAAGLSMASWAFAQSYGDDTPDDEYVYTLEAFSVQTSANDQTYKANESIGATRINTPLTEIPIQVSVLKPEMIENFQLFDPDEQGQFVASWLSGEIEGGGGGGSRLRGFVPLPFRNGFERTGVGEVVNLDRVEIIKGPLSAMFGRSNPGGLINYVTKKPARRPSTKLIGIYGSFDFTRFELHNTGPASVVSDDLYYRVDSSYTNTRGVEDFYFTRTYAFSTAWTYEPTDKTTITVEAEQLDRYQNRGFGGYLNRWKDFVSPVDGQSYGNVIGSINEELVESGFNYQGPYAQVNREITTLDLRVEQELTDNSGLKFNAQYWDRTFEDWRFTTGASAFYVDDPDAVYSREPYVHTQPEDAFSAQLDYVLRNRWERFENSLVASVDYLRRNKERRDFSMEPEVRSEYFPDYNKFDIYDPEFQAYDYSLLTRERRYHLDERERTGFLVSDRFAMLEGDLIGYGSLRYESTSTFTKFSSSADDTKSKATPASADEDATTYSMGVVYKILSDDLIVFANHSTSFEWATESTPTLDRGTGSLVPNVEGTGYEAGFKGQIWEDKIYWTATAFQITRENISIRNPEFIEDDEGNYPEGIPEYLGLSEERSEGYELEIFGDPTKNLSFTFALGYVDAYTKEAPDTPEIEGRKLLRAPEWNVGSTVTYRIKEGPLHGMNFGAAVRYTDEYYARFGGVASQVTGEDGYTAPTQPSQEGTERNSRIEEIRPAVTLWDFYVGYAWRTGAENDIIHTTRLTLKNAFDERWFTVTGREGTPLEIRGSYSVSF